MPEELLDKQNHSKNWIVLPLLGIVLLGLTFLVCCNQGNASEIPVSPNEEVSITTETALEENHGLGLSSKSTKAEIAEYLSVELKKKGLGFTSDLVKMSQEQQYEKDGAELAKNYTWSVSFPVTIGMSSAEISQKEGTDKILVRIKRLKIGKRLSYGDKEAVTIASNQWHDQKSEDQTFWNRIEAHTKSRFAKDILANRTVTNQLRNKAINVVNGEINKLLEGTDLVHSNFEFIIDKISN